MTLSQTAILTKQVITISIIALVLGTVSFIGYKIWNAYYLAHLPPVEEKPDIKFGLLPPLEFSKNSVSSSNFSYSIDTSTGNLPKVGVDAGFEKLSKVYFVTKTFATLLSSEKSKSLAEGFNIISPPQILSETNYRFQDKNKLLSVNLDNGNFTYKNEATISGKESLDDSNKLISDFEAVLSNLGVLKDDLRKGRTKVVYLKNDGGKLTPTEIKEEASAAQISLWPESINNKPIFTAEFDTSTIFGIVYKNANNIENYLSLNFNYFPVDPSIYATYPTKTTEAALEDLKNGKGSIVIEPTKPKVSITSAYLGYFLSENYSPYLQPIYIFEGPHFAAYVSAISEQFQSPTK